MLKSAIIASMFWAMLAYGEPTGQLNINTATVEQLEMLPKVGIKTAENIVGYREQVAPFKSVDELTGIRGIGAKTLEAIRKFVAVSGGNDFKPEVRAGKSGAKKFDVHAAKVE